jgi:hypothetical protein
VTIKNNSFLKKLHRRTKSNYDNCLENNLSKSDKFDTENKSPTPKKTLQKHVSSNFEPMNKGSFVTSDQTTKLLTENKKSESENKEIFIEKLELTPEEMIINQKKSDMKNNSDIFEFGKKKHMDLIYTKGLETSKSSNFEERVSQIRQKYQITEENENFFVIPEQNNEIEENLRKDSIKDKIQFDLIQNNGKALMEKEGITKKKTEPITKNEKSFHQKTISMVLTRQNSNKNNLMNSHMNGNSTSIDHQNNIMKIIQNLEKRVFFLENQVISLKNENTRLVTINKEFEKTIERFTKENNAAITVYLQLISLIF